MRQLNFGWILTTLFLAYQHTNVWEQLAPSTELMRTCWAIIKRDQHKQLIVVLRHWQIVVTTAQSFSQVLIEATVWHVLLSKDACDWVLQIDQRFVAPSIPHVGVIEIEGLLKPSKVSLPFLLFSTEMLGLLHMELCVWQNVQPELPGWSDDSFDDHQPRRVNLFIANLVSYLFICCGTDTLVHPLSLDRNLLCNISVCVVEVVLVYLLEELKTD